MMIITIVTETFWPEVNGVAMTLHRLAMGLLDKGHCVQLICPHHADRNITKITKSMPPGLLYHPVKGLSLPGYKAVNFGLPAHKLMRNIWKSKRPDIVYIATKRPLGWSALKGANRQGVPIISGFHTNFQAYSRHYSIGFLEKAVKRYLVSFHNKTLATLTPTVTQQTLLTHMGINNVHLLSRGVDAQLYSPAKRSLALRKQWGLEAEDIALIYVGRIAAEKNLDLAVKTYFELFSLNEKLNNSRKVKLVLVGDGPLTEKIQKENPQIIMAGVKQGEDLAAHYASGDIFVFPSLTETFGNVVLEAMASGLCIVSYNYAASAMHVKHKETGMVASFDNSLAFINAGKCYLNDPLLRVRIRQNAAQYAATKGWTKIVDQFEDILYSYSQAALQSQEIAS